jgi:hypothetical protein
MRIINIPLVAALLIASVAAIHAQTLPKTLTVKGEEYTGVFYKGRDEVRVKFTHDAGLASVLIADLPPEIQKEFPVDSTKAAQQLQDDAKKQNQIAAAAASSVQGSETSKKQMQPSSESATGLVPGFEGIEKLPPSWICLTVKARSITQSNQIVCEYVEGYASSGPDAREMYPTSRSQLFIISDHPLADQIGEGEVFNSGVIVPAGVLESESGRRLRNYKYVADMPERKKQ